MSDKIDVSKTLAKLLLAMRDHTDDCLTQGAATPEMVKLTVEARKEAAQKLIEAGTSVTDTAKLLGVHRATVDRDVGKKKEKPKAQNAHKNAQNAQKDDPDHPGVEDPDQIKTSIVWNFARVSDNLRAFKKITKQTSLDRAARGEISHAIDALVKDLRSFQTTLT